MDLPTITEVIDGGSLKLGVYQIAYRLKNTNGSETRFSKTSNLIPIIDALEDIKAYDIDVIDVSKITSLFEYMIIASADSTRQTKSLASNVQEKVKAAGGEIYGVEGEQTGEWMLVDLGDAIVHIMLPAGRCLASLTITRMGRPSFLVSLT